MSSGMRVEEKNRCLLMCIRAITDWRDTWFKEEARLEKMLAWSQEQLVKAKETLANTDPQNQKAMRTATNTVEIFDNQVAQMDEQITLLRTKIRNSYSESQRYHEQYVELTT